MKARKAEALWKGSLKKGEGSISTDSGTLNNAAYSFGTRFESGKGTNPEELIGAAHAGCFSMALSLELGNNNITPESIHTVASVSLEQNDDGFDISNIHLDVTGKIPGGDQKAFEAAAENARKGCPVSKVLNAEITMTTHFEG